jgi:hypothetical protein
MGGPGVECTSAGWSAPSPPTPHPIRPRDPGAHKRQGLLLCAEQAEVGVMATAQDRITIYGPKDDCTYIVEFRTAEGNALAISIPQTEAAVIRHFQAKMPYGLVVS